MNELKNKNENSSKQHGIELRKQKDLYDHDLKEAAEEHRNEIERLTRTQSEKNKKLGNAHKKCGRRETQFAASMHSKATISMT